MNAINTSDGICQIFSNISFISLLPSILESVILLGVFLMWIYLKKLPERIHQEYIVQLQHDLSKDIELFKKDISKDLEILKITRTQVEPKKLEAYILFADTFGNLFSDSEAFKKLNQKKMFYDIGAKLYFFATDQTIKKYIELREHVFNPANSLNGALKDPMIPIKLYSEIIFSMRQDLGYTGTKCTADDFLKTIM